MLLARLSWAYLKKHRLRWALTIGGVALGVAVLVAMRLANQAVVASFHRTVEGIAGRTQLQVHAGDLGFPEEVLERVQAIPEVAAAAPVIEAALDTGLPGQGHLLVVGVDMTGDRSLRDYQFESAEEALLEDPLVFLAQPDSLIVTREFAERNGLRVGSRIPLGTAAGLRWFTIRGIMRPGGLSQAFGGNLAVMDVYSLQHVLGRGRRFDRIDVALREGITLEEGQEALRRALGPGFEVEPPSARGRHFEAILRSFSLTLNITSVFAVLVGMFLIYNSFSVAVAQRRTEIGILRALGANRGQIRRLFLGEAAVAGLIGSGAGALAGWAMARWVAGYVGRLMQEVYGVAQSVESASAEPGLLAAGTGVGVLASLVAAWVPAGAAARVDPVQALQKGRHQVLSAGEYRRRGWLAAASACAAALLLARGRSLGSFYAGYVLAILAALWWTPALSRWLARASRPLLAWLRPVEGALAADSLLQAPRRTSATVAAVMLSLAMVIGFGGVARAIYESLVEWVSTTLNPDLFVTPNAQIASRTYVVPAELGAEIERLPGVRQVQLVRSARIPYQGAPVLLVAAEVAKLAETVHRRPVEGDLEEMYRRTAAGEATIVSESFARLRGLRKGDSIELPAPKGLLRLEIAGIVRDYSDQQGTLLIDRAVYRDWWGDESVNVIRVYLAPGAQAAEVKREILERCGRGRRLFVLANEEVRRYIFRLADQWFGMTYNQIAVAILVAVLGIVNTLTVSITDRRREFGLLLAVGGLRPQVRRTVWMEAVAIGGIGFLLGLGLGAVSLYYSLEMTRRDLAGLSLEYAFPLELAAWLAPVILGAAFLAGLGPAEAAVRGSLVEALEYE
ncbi:MAG: FtsX-like permease family protein [Bryobacterales bacterium]|nr:ABC transporter permease [Bryobacteraceae bacterium]MDW8129983.1 FtsX-like permease family protein [Bryobacterales bacterium]